MVARLLSFRAAPYIVTDSTRAAARARGQVDSATLPPAYPSYGRRENEPTMDGARGALTPFAAGFRLSASESRGGCSAMSEGDWYMCQAEAVGWALTLGREGLSGLPTDEKPARKRFGEAAGILHHV